MLAAYASHPDDLAAMLRVRAEVDDALAAHRAAAARSGSWCWRPPSRSASTATTILTLAAELAARASLAVDNARLYAAEQQARAEAEAALRARIESERQLHAILEHSPAIISVADRDGKLVLVNREYERRVGRSAAELLGRTIEELALIPPEHAQALMAKDRRVIEERRALQFEVDLSRRVAASAPSSR